MKKLTILTADLLPILVLVLTLTRVSTGLAASNDNQVPDLIGTWTGENKTYSEKKAIQAGLKRWS